MMMFFFFLKHFVDNGDDGKFRTLNSKRKKCTMLFPVKVTKTAANKKHDMSYGKSWSPNGIVENFQLNLIAMTVAVNYVSQRGS